MSFAATPTDGSATPIPMSSVVPDGTATPTALEGGPAVSSGGNSLAPVSIWVKDGNDLAQGATTDSAVTGDIAGSLSAKLRGLVKILTDVWDSTNHRLHVDGSGVTQPISAASALPGNITEINGSALSNANPMPTLVTAQSGYVAAWSSNPTQTAASSVDTLFKWGGSGNTMVNHIMLQNNTGANISFDLDTPTTAGSPILATGQTLFLDVQTTVLHLQSAAQQNINGTSSGNIVVRAWL